MMSRTTSLVVLVLVSCSLTAAVLAQESSVTGRVNLFRTNGSARSGDGAGIVVWLTPVASGPARAATNEPGARPRPKIIQRNKRFETRVLAVEVGSIVDFPNLDPFFHNVFSMFDGKRFDLGLYEAGGTRSVRFDKPGVCFIFCNIHSQMSAVVVVVDTPYFVTLSTPGEFQITRIPPGRYQLGVWAERIAPEVLKGISRQVTVEGPTTSLGVIRLQESQDRAPAHGNKYGKAYESSILPSPIYALP
jgi:plastocyanin